MIGFVMLCLECPNGGYITINKSGYPSVTNVSMQAKVWLTIEEAEKYRRMLKKQEAWEIREFLGLKLGGVK